MPILSVENKKITANLSDEELKDLELEEGTHFELIKAKKGVYILVEKEAEKEVEKKAAPLIDELELKIINYLKTKQPTDLVEGKFENLLSKEEQEKFKQMLADKKVEKFKSNPKYIKFIYRPTNKIQTPKQTAFENKEKPLEEFTIEKDGFVVTKNPSEAQRIGQNLSEQIKNGAIRGTRSFNGYFYIINSRLLDQANEKILTQMKKNKESTAEDLAQQLNLTPTLIRIACTFLGEEGIILEKRKDNYQIIE